MTTTTALGRITTEGRHGHLLEITEAGPVTWLTVAFDCDLVDAPDLDELEAYWTDPTTGRTYSTVDLQIGGRTL